VGVVAVYKDLIRAFGCSNSAVTDNCLISDLQNFFLSPRLARKIDMLSFVSPMCPTSKARTDAGRFIFGNRSSLFFFVFVAFHHFMFGSVGEVSSPIMIGASSGGRIIRSGIKFEFEVRYWETVVVKIVAREIDHDFVIAI
jgi:hypothetical protein